MVMTEEEQVDLGVLIAELRHAERPLCDMAADEIERLIKERDEARDMSTRFAKRWTKAIGIDAGLK